MYYYLSGNLAHCELNTCVIDCNGVGYMLTVSLITGEGLRGKIGEKVKLYTHLAVREDGVELFGFGNEDERRAFNMLIEVSGVGPKAAINILSVLTPSDLAMAVCTENTKAISKAPNVGTKTAARIILELKDKIAKQPAFSEGGSALGASSTAAGSVSGTKLAEATAALLVLGYDKTTAASALRGIDGAGMDVGQIIKAALKKLAR